MQEQVAFINAIIYKRPCLTRQDGVHIIIYINSPIGSSGKWD